MKIVLAALYKAAEKECKRLDGRIETLEAALEGLLAHHGCLPQKSCHYCEDARDALKGGEE